MREAQEALERCARNAAALSPELRGLAEDLIEDRSHAQCC